MRKTKGSRKRADSSVTASRMAASQALKRMQEEGSYAAQAIEEVIDASEALSESDKAFAATLVRGVVRTKGALDETIDSHLERPNKVRADVRRAMEIATFELLYLRKEAFSAVDQAVRLTGKSAPFAKGMVNAVLRKVAKEAERFPSSTSDESFDSFCKAAGFPVPLGLRLCEDVGEHQTRRLIEASGESAPVYLHLSSLQHDPLETLDLLSGVGITFSVVDDIPACIRLDHGKDVASGHIRDLIRSGGVIVSDLAAQRVAYECVRSHLPQSFLEIGAGRGTKTMLIQSLAQALHGCQIPRFVAVDSVASKRDVLMKRAKACGAHLESAITADGAALEEVLGHDEFEGVLVDAPCSGLGTMRRHPEIIWRVREEDIRSLAAIQKRILESASAYVAPKAHLVYSTCTTTQLENEGVLCAFLSSEAGKTFSVSGGFQTIASKTGPDSHFCSVLTRII